MAAVVVDDGAFAKTVVAAAAILVAGEVVAAVEVEDDEAFVGVGEGVESDGALGAVAESLSVVPPCLVDQGDDLDDVESAVAVVGVGAENALLAGPYEEVGAFEEEGAAASSWAIFRDSR